MADVPVFAWYPNGVRDLLMGRGGMAGLSDALVELAEPIAAAIEADGQTYAADLVVVVVEGDRETKRQRVFINVRHPAAAALQARYGIVTRHARVSE